MKIKTKDVRNLVSILDDIVAVYKDEHPKIKRNWRTYEQRVTERLKTAFRELKPLVHEAVSTITFVSVEEVKEYSEEIKKIIIELKKKYLAKII